MYIIKQFVGENEGVYSLGIFLKCWLSSLKKINIKITGIKRKIFVFFPLSLDPVAKFALHLVKTSLILVQSLIFNQTRHQLTSLSQGTFIYIWHV